MSMPWGLVGPAFDYPTPYAAENRSLMWRGGLLLALALVLTLLVSFRPEPESGAAAALLGTATELGSPVPLSLAAAFFAVLGVVNIVRATGQRRLLLAPGQPASLTGELAREAQGASPGAAWLQRALVNGAAEPLQLDGPWGPWLLRLSPELGHWPRPLHTHLARRLAHLLLCAGLLPLLAAVWALGTPVAAALASLGLGAIAVGVVGASAVYPSRPPPSPLAVLMWLLLGTVLAVAALLVAGRLPTQGLVHTLTQALVPLALPVALASLLWGLLLVEGLTLLAGRAQVAPVLPGRLQAQEAALNPAADLPALVRELDLELHRRWAEGVPNRRHAWQMPAAPPSDAPADRGRLTGVVLEESQPLLATADRQRPLHWPGLGTPELWLWLLAGLCLLWTVLGSVFWAWQGWTQLRDASVHWTKAGVGLALIVAGGHALRAMHLLWSRFEVDSTITWLEFQGEWARPAPGAAAVLRSHQVRATVAQVRSVFYAAADNRLGSRTLRGLRGDEAAARQWLQQLQQLAAVPSPVPAESADKRRPREGVMPRPAAAAPAAAAPAAAPAAAAARAPRYCAVCGTAVLAGARFCQHCGSSLPQA
jgi:hypothetical protein